MESYRSEFEQLDAHNKAVVAKDVLELGYKIQAFKDGKIDDDKFRALRLARGVYGQRQQGVQMIRIKLPFGQVTKAQLQRIASVADEYSTGLLHITTRQDIQIHYVSLDRTPQLWADLEKDDVTLREACGNTVRNVTASALAGINPNELFDVSPYAQLVFAYFLRKPFGQELGRKIKIAFSSDDSDDAYTFMHDFGFIPRIELVNGVEQRGFKVLLGGGLGAQPVLAQTAFEFLPEQELIPFIEASIRVFDRYGERNNRNKARLKYLITKLGLEAFMALVLEEKLAVQTSSANFVRPAELKSEKANLRGIELAEILAETNSSSFTAWLKTNVYQQKQPGYFAAFVKVQLGNFSTNQARALCGLLDGIAADDIRFTIDQSILIKYIKATDLAKLYAGLQEIGLADNGYQTVADVTACPGTDTCNLGIANSTSVAETIEEFIRNDYPDLVYEHNLKIKISGCMNACGQHSLAHIGLHGSSIKVANGTLPALQLLLGGGVTGSGTGRIAEKVLKFPSKRIKAILSALFDDFESLKTPSELFNDYYDRQGNKYFYNLLKPIAETTQVSHDEFIDWGQAELFKTAIGIGECAGVQIDLIATLLFDADEKLNAAQQAFSDNRFADSVYFAYAASISAAKALLLKKGVQCNTQIGIVNDFESHYPRFFQFENQLEFAAFLFQINQQKATKNFAENYLNQNTLFVEQTHATNQNSK